MVAIGLMSLAKRWKYESHVLYGRLVQKVVLNKLKDAYTPFRLAAEPVAERKQSLLENVSNQLSTLVTEVERSKTNDVKSDIFVNALRLNLDGINNERKYDHFGITKELNKILSVPYYFNDAHRVVNVTLGLQYQPSVTRILEKSMSPESRFFLERWKKQMIRKLGDAGFSKYQKGIWIP